MEIRVLSLAVCKQRRGALLSWVLKRGFPIRKDDQDHFYGRQRGKPPFPSLQERLDRSFPTLSWREQGQRDPVLASEMFAEEEG